MPQEYILFALIASLVIEVLLLFWVAVLNLIRYKFLGNKYVYVAISFVCVFLYAFYTNNHDGVTFLGVLNSIFDSFKGAVGSVDKDKLAFLFDENGKEVIYLGTLFKNAYTATSLITLAYLSIALILSFIRAFKNAANNKFNHWFTGKDVYYIFTDSRNETALPLAKNLIEDGQHKSTCIFVSRGSLKTQEGNEFKDMLVGKKINVRAENFSEKFCEKIFKKSYFWIRHNPFKKNRRYYIYLLFSNDETTTNVANCFKKAIINNRSFKKCFQVVNEGQKLLDDEKYNQLERIRVLITYQTTDLDLLHDYSGATLHIMSSLSKYDMISNRFLFDNPISNFVNLKKLGIEKDNKHMHVTFLGFGSVNRPIFEKMTYSYQLFGDNINKVNYHILDLNSESQVKAFENEYTDRKSPLFLYSVEACCDGQDLREYETIDRYIKSASLDKNRFKDDGFEIFIVSVINSNNDLNIANHLRKAIHKYCPDKCNKAFIFVRVGERNIRRQFIETNSSFAMDNPDCFEGFDNYNRNNGVPIVTFGGDVIMNDYLSKQFDFVNHCGFLVWKSYLKEAEQVTAKDKWLLEKKDSVNSNTEYVHSIRTKLSMLGIKVDKHFNIVLETGKNYKQFFDKKYFENRNNNKNEDIIKIANLPTLVCRR